MRSLENVEKTLKEMKVGRRRRKAADGGERAFILKEAKALRESSKISGENSEKRGD